MLNNIKLLLNSLSLREFILLIVSLLILFYVFIHTSLMPQFSQHYNNKNMLLNRDKLVEKYQSLLKKHDSEDSLLNKKEVVIKQSELLYASEINASSSFDNFKDLYLWMCNIENKYLVYKAILKHTDIKGLIEVNILAKIAKIKPKKCSIDKNIELSNIFFTEKFKIISIIGNKVKINNVWYSKEDNISEHISIKDIKPSFAIIKYHNKTKKVLLDEEI